MKNVEVVKSENGPGWSWIQSMSLAEVLRKEGVLYGSSVSGFTDDTLDSLVGLTGGKLLFKSDCEVICSVLAGYVFVYKDKHDPNTRVRVWSEQADIVKKVADRFRSRLSARPPIGNVYVLTRGPGGFSLSTVGIVKTTLERGNYMPGVLEQYDHILSCLKLGNPCGRLALLDGPPGTGKSHMIRGLISDVSAVFVIVSSSLVGSISGPDVVPVLLDKKGEAGSGPIVLILEDADSALVRREKGDLTGLGDVLNIGDGLLGELADLRIVATTNADRVDLDPAVTRPGRMCCHVKVGALDSEVATAVYERLMGAQAAKMSESTLAEVYRLARADGWEPDRSRPYRAGIYL